MFCVYFKEAIVKFLYETDVLLHVRELRFRQIKDFALNHVPLLVPFTAGARE